MQALIDVILPVFLVVGFGYVAVWRGYFSHAGVDGLMKFTQNFAIPCLLFSAIAKIDLSHSFDLRLLLSFYVGAASCFSIGLLAARHVFNRDWEDSIAIGFCCLFSNSVLLGLPITERAYGVDALNGNFAIIAFHSPFCYGLGITVMEITRARGQSGRQTLHTVTRAMFRNALIIGIMAGFFVNLTGLALPTPLWDAIDLMVRAALPAALFGIGGVLVRYRPEGDMRVIAMVCIVSLMVHPLIVWTLGTLSALPPAGMRSAVLTSAMAPGINSYIFASMYGRAQRVAASGVLIATAVCILTAWFWLGVLG